jgi:hypothetical protein
MRMMRMFAMLAAWLAMACGVVATAQAAAADCTVEAAALMRDESELPRLNVASTADRPILCITLETVMAFAGRLKAHVAHCPNSSYAGAAADWEKMRSDYAKRFGQRRCRRTLLN